MEPIKDTKVFQFIEHLTLEDLQEIVKDIYVLSNKTVEDCIHSTARAKIEIIEYVQQAYVQDSYIKSILGQVPPPDPRESQDDE